MSRANDLERQMLDLINEERTSRGLSPVELELRLNESSEDHSVWMFEQDVFSHTGQGGSSAGDRMRDAGFSFEGNWTWGENLAFQSIRGEPGLADDVVDLHVALMNSPGHRANILNGDFELIGVGIERGDFDGFDALMVTQNFATTGAPVQLDLAEPPEPAPPQPEPEPEPAPEPEADPDTPQELTPGQMFYAGFLASIIDPDFTFEWHEDAGTDGWSLAFDADALNAALSHLPAPPPEPAGEATPDDGTVIETVSDYFAFWDFTG